MMRWGDGSRKVVQVLEYLVLDLEKALRQIRARNSRDRGQRALLAKQSEVVPRKASKLQLGTTVPQTDTGGRDEYSQALERTREKELGKLIP